MAHQLKLRVLWFRDFLGLGINQVTLEQQYPITSYYFWPRTEAWEQLKSELDSKTWLSKTEKVEILNLTTDIINHWRQYRNTENSQNVEKDFFEADFLDLQN